MKKIFHILCSVSLVFCLGCTEAIVDQLGNTILVNGAVTEDRLDDSMESVEGGINEDSLGDSTDSIEGEVLDEGIPSALDEIVLDEDTSISSSSSDSGSLSTDGATGDYEADEPDTDTGYESESGGTASIPVTLPKEEEDCEAEDEGTYQLVMRSVDEDAPEDFESDARYRRSRGGNTTSKKFTARGAILDSAKNEQEGEVLVCEADRDSETSFSWQKYTGSRVYVAVLFTNNSGDGEIDLVRVKPSGSFKIHSDLLDVFDDETVYLTLISKEGFELTPRSRLVIQKQEARDEMTIRRDQTGLLDRLGF